MAAPGEFFPQQFAQVILQLAQSQKQFEARLHEQRQQAAARNFMDKQRLDLAEQAQAQSEGGGGQAVGEGGRGGQAGFDRPQAGFGAVGQFRQKSAESALGVRDQLQLTKGTADIARAAKLQDVTDGTLIKKALGDFADLGVATISKENVGVIPALREALRVKAGGAPKEGDNKEGDIGVNIGVDDSGKLVPVGRSADTDTSPTRQDISEMRLPDGSIIITRVGGTSAADQKAVAQLEATRASTKKTVQDIALSKARTEATKLLGQERGERIKRLADGIGKDDELRRLQAMFGIMKSTEGAQSAILTIKEERIKGLVLERSQVVGEGKRKSLLDEINLLSKELSLEINQSSIDFVINRNPNAKELLKDGGDIFAAILAASGDPDAPPGGNPDVRKELLKEKHNVFRLSQSEGLDVARTMVDELGPHVYKMLPITTSLPLQNNKTGKQENADFHQARDGIIPLNRAAWALANAIRSSKNKRGLTIHPEFETFGWTPQGARTRPNEITAASVAPVDESEFEAADEPSRDTTMRSLTQKLNKFSPGSPEAAAVVSELKKVMSTE